ncbi:MAG: hypothetical protein QME69_06740 [Candidatus Saccharicenans sp.]|nr:hypothetical protein [Candidatus Saccharicenans sp.]
MKKIRALLVACLVLAVAAIGAEPRLSFSLRGSYYVPSSTTFNKEYVPAVNASLKQLSDFLADLGLSGTSRKLSEISGTFSFGGELEFKAGPQFFIALGAEYIFKNLQTDLAVSGNVEQVAIDVNQQGKVGLSSLPLLLTIRINLPITTVRVYLGGGVGYYFNRAVITERWLWQENLIKVSEGSRKIVASAQNIFPHANLGADLAVSSRFYLSGDIRVPFGTVKAFKIKSDSLDSSAIGQNLTFTNSDGLETDFKWELIGPVISVSLKYKF